MTDRSPSLPKSVIVGSDLSAASDGVVLAAAQVAAVGEAALHIVSAFSPQSVGPEDSRSAPSDPVLAELRSALPAQLRRVLPSSVRTASEEVLIGDAAKAILDRARAVGADLIVLGPHRGTDVRADFLGTTADEVLRGSSVPCLIVRGPLDLPPRRVVLGVDLDDSDAALDRGLELTGWQAARRGGESGDRAISAGATGVAGRRDVTVTEVLAVQVVDSEDDRASHLRALEKRIDEAMASGRVPGGVRVEASVLVGSEPARVLIDTAERAETDLLIVGTRHKGKARGSSLGSNASAIARRAPCPVVLIPSD